MNHQSKHRIKAEKGQKRNPGVSESRYARKSDIKVIRKEMKLLERAVRNELEGLRGDLKKLRLFLEARKAKCPTKSPEELSRGQIDYQTSEADNPGTFTGNESKCFIQGGLSFTAELKTENDNGETNITSPSKS